MKKNEDILGNALKAALIVLLNIAITAGVCIFTATKHGTTATMVAAFVMLALGIVFRIYAEKRKEDFLAAWFEASIFINIAALLIATLVFIFS